MRYVLLILCLFVSSGIVYSVTEPVPIGIRDVVVVVDSVYKTQISETTVVRFRYGLASHELVDVNIGKCNLPDSIVGLTFNSVVDVYQDDTISFRPTDSTINRLNSYCMG